MMIEVVGSLGGGVVVVFRIGGLFGKDLGLERESFKVIVFIYLIYV